MQFSEATMQQLSRDRASSQHKDGEPEGPKAANFEASYG